MFRWVRFLLWGLCGIAFVALVTEPISVRTQLVVGVTAIGAMATIRALRLEGVWRHAFLAIGSALVLRYLFWRTVNTLPPVSDPLNFIPGILLYIAEIYSSIMLSISLFVVAAPLDRLPAPDLEYDDLPTVDVYIPTYNEDSELLAMTVIGAIDLDYPKDKIKVWILDDGGTDQKCNQSDPAKAQQARERRAELQALAAELGAQYLTRARNEHAKAGNMNNAFRVSDGEIIVVFDADHVPVKEFLRKTVGHFRRDPRLFLCQTPHFFTNPDPVERNLDTFKSMPSENEMFYGIIQKGLDKWNGAFFCGSAALVRRAALAEVGGFSGITITEDCETALDLHSRGWNSCYVDIPMISGLQPETFASFIGQRSRWARGMFQIFLLKNPVMKRGLSVAQKICYLSNMTFWFFPIFRLPFLVSPLLFIYFNMQIYVANIQEFFAYTVLYMIGNLMMQNYLYGAVRWSLVSEIYEFVQTIYLSGGLLSVILNPRKPTFNVTDKGQSLDNDHLSELSRPYFILFTVYAVSALVCAWRWFTEPDANELLMVVAGWNFFNLVLAGAGLGVVSERRTSRTPVNRPARLAIGPAILPAKVIDITYGGCGVEIRHDSTLPQFALEMPAILDVKLKGETAKWQSIPVTVKHIVDSKGVARIGFTFGKLKRRHYEVIKDLMYTDGDGIDAFRSGRRKRRGILRGVYTFLAWGYLGATRSTKLLIADFQKSWAERKRSVGETLPPDSAAGSMDKPPAASAAAA
jgi:cellulose synthase (UDP-forming)